jgi:predicted O-methyltransferase YrrM
VDATTADRAATIQRVRADPPRIHAASEVGIWSTTASCYEFLAAHVPVGGRTLETGIGISTVLFTLWGGRHTCVCHSADEASGLLAYLDDRGIDRSGLTIEVGSSTEVLPRLDPGELDLVFVDGGHGWPVPVLDWFYACSHLRPGGVCVLDDTHLPQVRLGLVDFLEADPRWDRVMLSGLWSAYRRTSEGPLLEEWEAQPFVRDRSGRRSALTRRARVAAGRLRR